MDWFQTNSSSELIYMLTEDVTKIDFFFNETKIALIETVFNLIIAFIICNIFLWLLMTIPLAIGCYVFYPVFKKYLSAVQYFYRLESSTKAELLNIYLQTYEGIIMFRNMNKLKFFDSRFCDATENFQRATTHLNNVSGRYIGVRKFFLNTYFVALVYFIPIFIKEVIHKETTSLWLTSTWQTPLSVSWTYRLVRSTNSLFNHLANMAKYMLSIKRAENFLEHPYIEDLDPGKIEEGKTFTNAIE